ncbi:MAG: carboxypeptidase regulatory-like domain-containing protein, partial [Acidobacteria bacterium]|nr:carboxypeptidase regulatory-like domain-containing protein [Acidobacteriota bacterium]
MLRRLGVLLILVTLALCAVSPALAQSQATTGVIEGTVSDESGGPLPGVTVTLLNTATNFEQVLVTDSRGRFRGVLLPLGPYKVTAMLEGFTTLVREGIDLTVGVTINLRLTMKLSAVEDVITVTGEAALVETSRVENSVQIDREAIEGLPNNGRNMLDFMNLTPGVGIVQGPDGDEISVNGQKGIQNN